MAKAAYKHCVLLALPGNFLAYDRPSLSPHFWHGTIQFSDKQDTTGLFCELSPPDPFDKRRNMPADHFSNTAGRF